MNTEEGKWSADGIHKAQPEGPVTYRVKWEIDLEAGSPVEAARKALEIHRNSESTATHFLVERNGKEETVDLFSEDYQTAETEEKGKA